MTSSRNSCSGARTRPAVVRPRRDRSRDAGLAARPGRSTGGIAISAGSAAMIGACGRRPDRPGRRRPRDDDLLAAVALAGAGEAQQAAQRKQRKQGVAKRRHAEHEASGRQRRSVSGARDLLDDVEVEGKFLARDLEASPASAGRPQRRLSSRRHVGDRLSARRGRTRSSGRTPRRAAPWMSRILASALAVARRRRRSVFRPVRAEFGLPRFDPLGVDGHQRIDGVDDDRHRRRAVEDDGARRRRSAVASAASRPRRLATGRTVPRRLATPSSALGACGTRATAGRRMTSATSSGRQRIELAARCGSERRGSCSAHSAASARRPARRSPRSPPRDPRRPAPARSTRPRPAARRHSPLRRRPRSGARPPPLRRRPTGSHRRPAGSRRWRRPAPRHRDRPCRGQSNTGAIVLDLGFGGVDDLFEIAAERGDLVEDPAAPYPCALDIFRRLARQAADVVRDDGEAAARFAGAGRLDRTAHRQHARLHRDQRDGVDDLFDVAADRFQTRDRRQAGSRVRERRSNAGRPAFDGPRALLQAGLHLARRARWPVGVLLRELARCSRSAQARPTSAASRLPAAASRG